jgi:hypothetical protein
MSFTGKPTFIDRESNWAGYNDFAKLTTLNPTTNTYVQARADQA